MKMLVCIAYYGTANQDHVRELIAAYEAMDFDVDIVVVSEAEKDLAGVEVRVGVPTSDPYSLPFAHKLLFDELVEDYDLFVYSEDDTLIRQRNVEAFLWACEILPSDAVAGFLRTEETPNGTTRCPDVHNYFHWDAASTCDFDGALFAEFTNPHSACYMLTQAQLRKCLESGNFLTRPHEGRYSTRVTAATDPYVVCGLRKLICLDRLDEFLLPHLSNKYADSMGVPYEDLLTEREALRRTRTAGAPTGTLFAVGSRLATPDYSWDKKYHEPASALLLSQIPADASRVLSIGTGSGLLERELLDRGHDVVGVPLDSVIGAVAESRGIETTAPDFEAAFAELAGQRFDAIVASNVMQHIEDPIGILRRLRCLLTESGIFVSTIPNIRSLRLRRRLGRIATDSPQSLEHGGVHPLPPSVLHRWLASAGFANVRVEYGERDGDFIGRVGNRLVSDQVLMAATRATIRSPRVTQHRAAVPVSIGVPVFNGERFLAETLDALRRQTFTDFEVIVSDNGSTDATESIARSFASEDPRIRYFRHDENRGAAFNYGFVFEQSVGEFFCWNASDDMRHPRNLERSLEAFASNAGSVVAVTTEAVFIGPDGGVILHDLDDNAATGDLPASRLRRILDNVNRPASIFGLMRASTLELTNLIGAFDSADYVLLAELALHGEIVSVPEQLFSRRLHDGMSRQANVTKLEVARWFDPAASAPRLSSRQRLGVEYLRAVVRADLAPSDEAIALAAVPTRMLLRRGRVLGGLAKQRVRASLAR